MPTPVLIAAHDEELFLGRTLGALTQDPALRPIVIANGCTDRTAEVADSFGVEVHELAEAGKLPALQFGLQQLGERALEPVLQIDADSVPRFPDRWARAMLCRTADVAGPSVVAGPVRFVGTRPVEHALRAARGYVGQLRHYVGARIPTQTFERARLAGSGRICGANMAYNLKNIDALEALLALDHIWPNEERAIVDALRTVGGDLVSVIAAHALVDTSDRYAIPLQKLLCAGGKTERRALFVASYRGRAADGSIPYQRANTV